MCLADPALFWSAGEDGVVRQYDTRAPTHKAYGSPNVLVNLMNAGKGLGLVLVVLFVIGVCKGEKSKRMRVGSVHCLGGGVTCV